MFFNIHGKSSKYLKYEVKTNLVQGFRFYVTFFGDGKRACRFLNNANLQIRRFVKKTTNCSNDDLRKIKNIFKQVKLRHVLRSKCIFSVIF